MTEWYTRVDARTPLTQGDLVLNCPIVQWDSRTTRFGEANRSEVLPDMVVAAEADVVVMTQACDLEEEKVENVILCPHIALSDHKTLWEETVRQLNQNPNSKNWERHCTQVRNGFVWNLAMLNAGANQDLSLEQRIVDFHEVFTIPRDFLESFLQQRGTPRLRLLPPYREHLSQAFARFFMRVGLPVPVQRAW
jgi:hypothetical protein